MHEPWFVGRPLLLSLCFTRNLSGRDHSTSTMATCFRSRAFAALIVLVTICSLHTGDVDAAACPSGFKSCGSTKCSTNIKTDATNCGNCGVVCATRPHSTPTCTNAVCTLRCKPNYANCDTQNPNGCEVATLTNPNHCGQCNRKCPTFANTVPTCRNGQCAPKCKPGYADCNRDMAKDGCETLVAGADALNCGKCGALCKEDQYFSAVSKCSAGKCGILLCYRGMTDCNGVLADGCETNTFGSPLACGSCGNVCPTYPHAVPLCANGFCRSVCKEGFAYCYAPEIDQRGCSKIFFDRDASNCGSCNTVCAVGQSCQQGVCKNI